MPNKIKIMIIEDEDAISNFIATTLKANAYAPLLAKTAGQALSMIPSHCPDLILLDLGLPDMDGIEILKKIREWSAVPVIVVSARGEESDKVEALDLGADDYISKPFNPLELVARVKSQLRRYTQLGAMQIKETQIAIRGLVLDTESRSVTVDGEAVRLTPLEYKILELLCRHPGKVFSTEEIYRQVWNDDVVSDNAIAVHVRHIREKIEINPKEPRYLKVVWGVGYKIERSE